RPAHRPPAPGSMAYEKQQHLTYSDLIVQTCSSILFRRNDHATRPSSSCVIYGSLGPSLMPHAFTAQEAHTFHGRSLLPHAETKKAPEGPTLQVGFAMRLTYLPRAQWIKRSSGSTNSSSRISASGSSPKLQNSISTMILRSSRLMGAPSMAM